MHKSEIDEFVNKVKGKKITMTTWGKNKTFVPDGTYEYNSRMSIVLMKGTLDNTWMQIEADFPVLNGFGDNPTGEKWQWASST